MLKEQATNGIDKKALLAGLNYDEFKYREADFGRYPKGLLYGLQVFDSWLYDDNSPWINVEANATFAELKKEVEGRYFEELIEKYLLDNPHRTVLTLEPVPGLTDKKDEELKKKLADYKASLSKEEIAEIVKYTADLKEYQDTPDTPEDLEKIPLLELKDLKKESEKFIYEKKVENGVDILFHNIFTNGIVYLTFVFDLKNLDAKLISDVSVLKKVVGMMDTENYSYGDLFNEINIKTGGITGSISTYTDSDDASKFKTTIEISVKVLHENLHYAFDLVKEILTKTKLGDTKRLKEIFGEQYARLQSDLAAAGHQTSAVRAMSYVSPAASVSDRTSGIGYLRHLEELISKIDTPEGSKEISDKLKYLCNAIFRAENLLVDVTCTDKEYAGIAEESKKFADSLFSGDYEKTGFEVETLRRNEAFKTAGQVQYVCRAGNFASKGLKYNGALRVLKVMMGYDYLWKNIRVIGGAYGCMSTFAKNGDSAFVTYRDPNLKNSIDVFEKASEYLRSFDEDERVILKYIIGAISDLDTPKTPSAKGTYGLSAYLCNAKMENIQRNRDELLGTTKETIRELSKYVDAFMEDKCLCVIGSSEKIDSEKDLFDNIEQLVNK